MEHLLTAESLLALLTLTGLEIVLGIDNIVFIAILCGKLPISQQAKARQLGLFLAMFMRIGLLLAIGWVMGLTQTLFEVIEHEVTGRDLILLMGGLFLIAKATYEIHHKLEGEEHADVTKTASVSFSGTLIQIVLLDIVFSLDSVITAVGMAQHIEIMIAAVVVAVGIMMAFAGAVSRFVEKHPTFKMLALSFLLLIGVVLVADGLGKHIEKGYIYFAMGFSLFVEILNLKMKKTKTYPVKLHGAG
ncbi:MAG: TerC family protein [Candidatus Omnitrophica bacterium]|nr:TerC family protein [Candidatus Omnitrophota bacterium]